MENFREENIEKANICGKPEERVLNETEKTEKVLEGCLYENKETFDNKDLRQLARLESQFNKTENRKKWSFENETERCELKKKLEKTLLGQEPKKVSEFWKNNEREFCDTFGRARSREAETQFNLLRSGVLNEIIATKILSKLLGFEVAMSSSPVDIKDKIDLFCFSEKIILAVQVKSKSIKDMRRGRDEVIESVGISSPELKKNEFIAGCSALEEQLDLKNRGIELKKVWLIIPLQDKRGDGGEYDAFLDKEVKGKIEGITRHSI